VTLNTNVQRVWLPFDNRLSSFSQVSDCGSVAAPPNGPEMPIKRIRMMNE